MWPNEKVIFSSDDPIAINELAREYLSLNGGNKHEDVSVNYGEDNAITVKGSTYWIHNVDMEIWPNSDNNPYVTITIEVDKKEKYT